MTEPETSVMADDRPPASSDPDSGSVGGAAELPAGWSVAKNGRQFIPNAGRNGPNWRVGDETIEQARERDLAKQAKLGGKKKPDRKPKVKPQSKPKADKPTVEQLAAALEIPLALPVVYVRLATGCDYCANSMRESAPAAARDVAMMAEKNEPLRRLLEWWHAMVTVGVGSQGIAMYAGIPVLHHMAPDPVYNAAGPLLGMPPREPQPGQNGHQHHQPEPAPAGPAPGPRPAPVGMRPRVVNTPPYAATTQAQHAQAAGETGLPSEPPAPTA